ncbi:uncharacterized protein LOC121404558 [Drosophila obscura]|uniref:uncharacterized protein LOC121404558 n=1 Tax=Drosophila obscura TaxID=7282 RepID=UPI001BB2B3D8|nr:uncharacterized protein LOC121404558 [Drosophila obscura]
MALPPAILSEIHLNQALLSIRQVPAYDGSAGKLSSFIKRVEYIHELYPTQDARQSRILFGAVEVQLIEEAQRLSQLVQPNTWTELKNALIDEFKDHTPYEELLRQIYFTKFNGSLRRPSNQKLTINGNIIKIIVIITLMVLTTFAGLDFPLNPRHIQRFMDINPDISITLFGFDNEKSQVFGPLFYPKEVREHHINMLLIESDHSAHYTWIKRLSALISSQTGRRKVKQWFCNICLNYSQSEEASLRHKEICSGKVSTLPHPKQALLKFKNQHRALKVPFVVYGDFECLLEPTNIAKIQSMDIFLR